jgi:hypothetical protein
MLRTFAALLLTLSIVPHSAMAKNSIQVSKDEIGTVIEKFRISLINHDKVLFKTLFLSDQIPWIMVFSEEMIARKRQDNPNYPSMYGSVGSPLNALRGEKTVNREEKMWNIKIDTDGYLASVHFNYSDHINGYKRAWGTESWDLVNNGKDWKIISVSYVVTQNPVPEK